MSGSDALSEAAKEAAAAAAAEHRIETTENPNPRVDYLVRLDGTASTNSAAVTLHYVPHRLIVREKAFRAYLGSLTGLDGGASLPERLALRILGDLNDEIVPRWLQVVVAIDGHRVLVEDRQPKWDKPALTARVGGI